MITHQMKFLDQMICFQEVPDEIALSFSITNCPFHCKNCHSTYLWEDKGVLVFPALKTSLKKYEDYITCVLFMGGTDDKQRDELIECLKECKKQGFKTCVYDGRDIIDWKDEMLLYLDYYKIGSYKQELGGLKNKNTNQKMYIKNSENQWEDITYKFWEKIL